MKKSQRVDNTNGKQQLRLQRVRDRESTNNNKRAGYMYDDREQKDQHATDLPGSTQDIRGESMLLVAMQEICQSDK